MRSASDRKTYAGIGARETPLATLSLIEDLASRLAREGWTLRTGLSPGADQAFHRGALRARGRIELYLPWQGFEEAARTSTDAPESQGRAFEGEEMAFVLGAPRREACDLAASFHPAWQGLDRETRLLRSRDMHQILGERLDDPVSFVVCWTPDGSLDGVAAETGGTGQALRVARHRRVPVFNLARPEHARLARVGKLGRGG